MIDLRQKRIAITGGRGFLGSHLVRKLVEEGGCRQVQVAERPEYDLREPRSIAAMFERQRPEILIRLAAEVGGSGADQGHPGQGVFKFSGMDRIPPVPGADHQLLPPGAKKT